jgi:iron complex outermembrane recepter protein
LTKCIPAGRQFIAACGHTDFIALYSFISFADNLLFMRMLLLSAFLICFFQHAAAQAPAKDTTTGRPQKDTASLRDTVKMQQVIVSGRRPLYRQESFGTVVNVASSVLAKGSSALQLLERSPGVTIDHRYNSIALNGKSGVTVMLNGKTMYMSMDQLVIFLDGLSADDVEEIQLMTTPPASGDAEGSAGIINIVLKKNRQPGGSAALTLTQGYGYGEKDIADVELARNTQHTSIYGSYNFNHDRSYDDLYGAGYQNFPILGGPMDVQFRNDTKRLQNNHDVRLGIDQRLDTNTTVGANISFSRQNASSSGINSRILTVLPDSPLTFDGTIGAVSHFTSLINSIYVERQLRQGEKLNLDLDYLIYDNNNASLINSSFSNDKGGQAGTNNDTLFAPYQQGYAHTRIRVGVGKTDYQRQWTSSLKIQAGVKATYTTNTSSSAIESLINSVWTSRPETTNDEIMKEGIGAAYLSGDIRLNASTQLTTGLRYEYSHTMMNNALTGESTIDRRLGVFFPAIFLSGKFNDNAGWQLSYTKRISRPSYEDLSSYVDYNDPISVFTGNQLLKPTITDNLKWGYHYKGYAFSILLSRDDNPIARYQLTTGPDSDLMYISPQNLDWQNNLTLQADLPFRISRWWDMIYSLSGGWRKFEEHYTPLPVEHIWWGYNLHSTQTFRIPRNYMLEISGWYNSSAYGGTARSAPVGSVDAGIKKELKKDQGTFQVSITDVFRTIRYKNYYGYLTPDVFDVKSIAVYNPESRRAQIIKLTYSRSFGRSTSKPRLIQDTSSQEEQQRVLH